MRQICAGYSKISFCDQLKKILLVVPLYIYYNHFGLVLFNNMLYSITYVNLVSILSHFELLF